MRGSLHQRYALFIVNFIDFENALPFGPVSLHIVVICQVMISVLFCTVANGS